MFSSYPPPTSASTAPPQPPPRAPPAEAPPPSARRGSPSTPAAPTGSAAARAPTCGPCDVAYQVETEGQREGEVRVGSSATTNRCLSHPPHTVKQEGATPTSATTNRCLSHPPHTVEQEGATPTRPPACHRPPYPPAAASRRTRTASPCSPIERVSARRPLGAGAPAPHDGAAPRSSERRP